MIKQPSDHKLLILSRDFVSYGELIERGKLPGLAIFGTDDLNSAIQLGAGCDLLFGEPSLVCKVINQLDQITWVQSTWAGIETLVCSDLRRNYILTNVRNVYGRVMSEFVFGYLLFIERKIMERWQFQSEYIWNETPPGTLHGKLIGLLGVGSIGSYLARTAHHFRMIVHGFSMSSENCTDVDRYFHTGALNNFLHNLDYLVCCLPGTSATKHIVDGGALALLPDHAWVINVGRGSTIDTGALVNALKNRKLGGAILDVFEEEPLSRTHPLWTTPNTFITCHTAAINHPPDIAAVFINNYRRLIRQEPLVNQVNFDQQY